MLGTIYVAAALGAGLAGLYMAIYSFGRITTHLAFGLLVLAFGGDFTPAYQVVSWLCWVPNAVWAEWYVLRSRPAGLPVSLLALRS